VKLEAVKTGLIPLYYLRFLGFCLERAARRAAETAADDRDRSVALGALGDVYVAQGNLTAALTSFEESHAIRRRLATSDPGNAAWQRDLAISFERLGRISLENGDSA
jgi:Flp pilus assembly protein TadD